MRVAMVLALSAAPAAAQTNWVQHPCMVFDCKPAMAAVEALSDNPPPPLARGLAIASVTEAGPSVVLRIDQEPSAGTLNATAPAAQACGLPELRAVIAGGGAVIYSILPYGAERPVLIEVTECEE